MAYEYTYGQRTPRNTLPNVREPYYSGTDPTQMFRNDRQRAVATGDMVNQDLADFGNEEDYYRQWFRDQGMDAYAGIRAGEGGYRGGEADEIIGRDRLNGMRLTPEQLAAYYQTDDEREAIMGDPSQAQNWFDPEWLDSLNTEANQRVRENVGDSATDLRGTYDEADLGLSTGYRDELGNIIGSQASGVRGAIDSGGANVRGTINRDRLTVDPNFLRDYRMTDRDVDDMMQQAALTQGNVSRGRADAVRRAAAGSGMSPLALTAGLNELTTRGDQQANRAMLDARIAGRGMQADRLRDAETLRLGAEGRYAGLASDTEMGLAGMKTNAEMGLGDRAYGAASDFERQRLGAAQDRQSRRYQIAANIADRGYDATNRVNNNNMDNARYLGEQGEAVYRRTDDRRSDRAGQIANARQVAAGRSNDAGFERDRYIDNATAGRVTGVADARRGDEREYRAWLAGQQGQANDNVGGTYDRRIRNYGQQGDQAARSSQGAFQDQQNGFWRGVGGALLGSAAGAFGGKLPGAIAGAVGGAQRRRGSSHGDGWGG